MWQDQSVRVIEVFTDCMVQLVQLLFAGYAPLQDPRPHASYKVRAYSAAGMTGRIDVCFGLDADIH